MKRKKVALAFPISLAQLRGTVAGIMEYAEQQPNWDCSGSVTGRYSFSLRLDEVLHGRFDGVIAAPDSPQEMNSLHTLNIPAVSISSSPETSIIPRVMFDNRAIGRQAAEHLLECGFRRFAFFGVQDLAYSQPRQKGFVERIEKEGCHCNVLEGYSYAMEFGRLEEWLKKLEPPLGLLAAQDELASMAIEACTRLRQPVPFSVGVVGVDNNEIVCNFARPTISSVEPNGEDRGYQAALMLDQLMKGETPPEREIRVPPHGVVRRESTNVVAAEDIYVSRVAHYIRDNLTEPLSNTSLAKLVSISGRWLEHRFKKCLGRTMHQFISETRVERAKELLTQEDNLPLYKVAEAVGIDDARQLRLVFQRIVGVTPKQYRQQHRRDQSGSL